jgi:hypothetical protein
MDCTKLEAFRIVQIGLVVVVLSLFANNLLMVEEAQLCKIAASGKTLLIASVYLLLPRCRRFAMSPH